MRALRSPVNADGIFQEIEREFPYVKCPQGLKLSFHEDECPHCYFLQHEMEQYGDRIPRRGLRWLNDELSCLSSKGMLWVLSSLLRHCVASNDTYDGVETEFLIYHLSRDVKYQRDLIKQLSALSNTRTNCLAIFIECCCVQERWPVYCAK